MNPDTGEVRQFSTKKQAIDAGFTVTLTSEQATELLKLSRVQRRNWARRLMTTSALEEIASRGTEES